MLKDRWLSLDDKTNPFWDSIEDKFKNIILGYTPSSSPTSSFTTCHGKPSNTPSNKSPFKSRKGSYTNLLTHLMMSLKRFKKKLELMTLHSQLTLNLIPLQTF
jgi:hypothetical protein